MSIINFESNINWMKSNMLTPSRSFYRSFIFWQFLTSISRIIQHLKLPQLGVKITKIQTSTSINHKDPERKIDLLSRVQTFLVKQNIYYLKIATATINWPSGISSTKNCQATKPHKDMKDPLCKTICQPIEFPGLSLGVLVILKT